MKNNTIFKIILYTYIFVMLFFMASENLCIIGAIMLIIALVYTGIKRLNTKEEGVNVIDEQK